MLQIISYEGWGPLLHLMLGIQSQVIKRLPILQAPQLSSLGLNGQKTTSTFVNLHILTRGIWVFLDSHVHINVHWSLEVLQLNRHDMNLYVTFVIEKLNLKYYISFKHLGFVYK